jgi:hypothetical protein
MRREAAAMTARRFLPSGVAALIQLAAVEAHHGQSDMWLGLRALDTIEGDRPAWRTDYWRCEPRLLQTS